MAKQYLTQDRFEELKKELADLKTKARIEVSERLKRAKEYGDLSENSEYAEAREEQDQIERKISELEEMLKSSEIIKKQTGAGEVSVGSTISVSKNGTNYTYQIVGANETRPEEGRISNESPLGQTFLGKKIGDKIEIKTSSGSVEYKILGIE